MIFKTRDFEKRLTQTQVKLLINMLGGMVARIRNDKGHIVVVNKRKVGNTGTVGALEEIGAIQYNNQESGWNLTINGTQQARKLIYLADVIVEREIETLEYVVKFDNESYKVTIQNNDVRCESSGGTTTLFQVNEAEPAWPLIKSKSETKAPLVYAAFEEQIVKGIHMSLRK